MTPEMLAYWITTASLTSYCLSNAGLDIAEPLKFAMCVALGVLGPALWPFAFIGWLLHTAKKSG